jgi:hypothetical protein
LKLNLGALRTLGGWLYSRGHRGHVLARIGAATARLGAGAHICIATEPLAVLRTALADLGAHTTCAAMHSRTAQHKVCADLADLGAIKHQPNVGRLGMLATHLQAMRNGRQANAVAVQTVRDAGAQLLIGVLMLCLCLCHGMFLSFIRVTRW